jgi:hypothetical protein
VSKVVWIITVVDPSIKRWAPAQTLARCGAQPTTIARYARVRRTMTAAALRRRMATEHQN